MSAGYVTTEEFGACRESWRQFGSSVQMLTPMTPYKDFQGGNRCSFKNFASLLPSLDFGPTVALDVCSAPVKAENRSNTYAGNDV